MVGDEVANGCHARDKPPEVESVKASEWDFLQSVRLSKKPR
jgi:hypothetical protein